MCVFLGVATGYWAVFVTVASEQFGTNIRATVTTTAPNFVRGSLVPVTLAFEALRGPLGVTGAALVGRRGHPGDRAGRRCSGWTRPTARTSTTSNRT